MMYILRKCGFVLPLSSYSEELVQAIAKTHHIKRDEAQLLFEAMGDRYYIMLTARSGSAYNTPNNMSCTDPFMATTAFDASLVMYRR